jgi:hypothetical protein
VLLRAFSKLKPHPLTVEELLFVLAVHSYKWTKAAPFPKNQTIANIAGAANVRTIRRPAQHLEEKGYLRREYRNEQTATTTRTSFISMGYMTRCPNTWRVSVPV